MWTTEQNQAITARGGTLLVSAAAGSGKTSVLVERVISLLTDEQKICPADSLLVVTFTKAATAQMKSRITEALAKRLSEEPENAHLRRQQMLLPFAKICTIDSFCNDLARENFHELGIDPDYKILDNHESMLLREEAAAEALEEMYAKSSPEFEELVELLFRGRDDRELTDTIYTLNNIAGAYPFPEEWLDSLYEPFTSGTPLMKSGWGKIIAEKSTEALKYCVSVTESLIEKAGAEEELVKAYVPTLASDIILYGELMKALKKDNWDDVRETMLKGIVFKSLGRVPRGYETPLKSSVINSRDRLKKTAKKLGEYFCVSEAENDEDMEYCAPIVKKLAKTVLLFRKKLAVLKSNSNSYEFSDISSFALSLLIKKDGGKNKKTKLAAELSERFTEILIDEYQDINEAQDLIFQSISNDGKNLFMVGDVKQSIYRFRQAMPELFLKRRGETSRFDGVSFPATIRLDKNFRSRDGVTSAVNFIFNQIMSERAGEIDYKNKEELTAAAQYPETNHPCAQVHIVDMSEAEQGGIRDEAAYVALMIDEMLADGLTVGTNDNVRAATFKDFCILLRSDKGRAAVFTEELLKRGIPASAEVSGGLLSAPEVMFIISLLQVIDNPARDVPLISVMLSPVFGFTPDEIAKLRIDDRVSNIYTCLRGAENQNKKAADFLGEIRRFRSLSAMLPPGELVRRLFEETGFLAIAGSMRGGQGRRANLLLFQNLAAKYDESGHNGLPGFMRFIGRIAESGKDIDASSAISDTADAVKVITIHKSKGLEFPVCILANCSGKINDSDLKKNYIIHQRHGIGIIRREPEKFIQYNTVSKLAVNIAAEQSAKSEELRVLYVALTRAMERIIIVSSLKNPSANLLKLSANAVGGAVPPFAVTGMGNYADWILSAMLRHPDAQAFREAAGVDLPVLQSGGRIKAVISKPPADGVKAASEDKKIRPQVSPELLSEVDKRLSYKYPYEPLSAVVAKQAASQIDSKGIDTEFFASSRPAFMSGKGMTGAQKGIAFHTFMQFADYGKAFKGVENEIKRLVAEGRLTEREGDSIDVKKVETFFKSRIAVRMLNSGKIFREKRFTFSKKSGEMYEGLAGDSADEEIIIQGMVDCAFVENGKLVIVDYKTDTAPTEKIKSQYSAQLGIYREAMEKVTGLKVKETVIYSFAHGAEIQTP